MKITYKQLVAMMGDAVRAGQVGSCETRNQDVEEIISAHDVADPQELRVYAVAELQTYPPGTEFFHSALGKGKIVNKRGVRSSFMQFESGASHSFTTDQFPWDMPMIRLIGE